MQAFLAMLSWLAATDKPLANCVEELCLVNSRTNMVAYEPGGRLKHSSSARRCPCGTGSPAVSLRKSFSGRDWLQNLLVISSRGLGVLTDSSSSATVASLITLERSCCTVLFFDNAGTVPVVPCCSLIFAISLCSPHTGPSKVQA